MLLAPSVGGSNVVLRLLASAITKASCGRSLAAFHLDKFCDLFAMVAYEIAPPNPVSLCLVVDTRG